MSAIMARDEASIYRCIVDSAQRSLSRWGILAAGSDPYVYNAFGEIPSTVIAPALLFDDVTLKRAEQRNDKLPYYPPPE